MIRVAKRITAAAVFIVVLLCGLLYYGKIFRPDSASEPGFDVWSWFYEEDDNTLDVVLLGSSAIYRYWAAPLAYEQQGFTSFVVAHPCQRFSATPLIIDEIERSQNPDLIVVETRELLDRRSNDFSAEIDDEFLEKDMYRLRERKRRLW